MPRIFRRSLAAVALSAALLLIAPLAASASLEDGASTRLSIAVDLAHWFFGWWPQAATAPQEASPDLDPNGIQPLPPTDEAPTVGGATPASQEDGETSPDLDPNG